MGRPATALDPTDFVSPKSAELAAAPLGEAYADIERAVVGASRRCQRESKSHVASSFGMPCALAYSRTALRV
jgi:hypothetical protein